MNQHLELLLKKLAESSRELADHTRRYCATNDQSEARMKADRWRDRGPL
jgi:hypothetical protein